MSLNGKNVVVIDADAALHKVSAHVLAVAQSPTRSPAWRLITWQGRSVFNNVAPREPSTGRFTLADPSERSRVQTHSRCSTPSTPRYSHSIVAGGLLDTS